MEWVDKRNMSGLSRDAVSRDWARNRLSGRGDRRGGRRSGLQGALNGRIIQAHTNLITRTKPGEEYQYGKYVH